MREVDRIAARVRAAMGEGRAATDGQSVAAASLYVRWRQRLRARLPLRLDPGRGPAWAVGLAVVIVAIVTGAWLLAERPQAQPVSVNGPQLAMSATPSGAGGTQPPAVPQSSTPAPPPASSSRVVVDVAGKVRRPGLYRLPAGARIDDAVRVAGGPLPRIDLSSLNLAARIVDGQQIRVGLRGAPPGTDAGTAGSGDGPGAGSNSGTGPGSDSVDLNTASLPQLDALPGVGPVLAQHILDWRTQHGQFTSIDQLNDVSGIGDVKFAALRSRVTV